MTPERTNRLCRRARSVVISGHVTRHVVDFSNYTDFSTSTRPGEGAIYRYLSRQGKIAGDIHETKSSELSLS